MKASIKNTNLPYRGEPTKPVYKKPVVGDVSKYLRVELPCQYNPRPAPIPKRKTVPKKKPKAPKKSRREAHQKPQFWTDERIRVLISLHGQGITYADIAKHMGTTRGAVSSRVKRLIDEGVIEPKTGREHWLQEDIDMLMKLKAKGLTMAEISDRIGRSTKSCTEQFRRQNAKQIEKRAVFRRMADCGEHDRQSIG